ncbi:MAG: transposase family protein [Thermoflexales bacterium]
MLLENHFDEIPDARREHAKKYLLTTILILAVIGVLGGRNDWVAIAEFCRLWRQRLSELGLGKGMSSHDTFRYVFAKLNPDMFQECFMNRGTHPSRLMARGFCALAPKVP